MTYKPSGRFPLLMRLEKQHEIIGMLHAVRKNDSCYKLQFTCTIEIELPLTALPQKKLTFLIGKRIGIFNYEDNYKIRVIKRKKSLSKTEQ